MIESFLAPVVSDILPIVEDEDVSPPIEDVLVSAPVVPTESPEVVVVVSPDPELEALSLHATKAPIAKTNKSFFIVMMIDF
ncbi:MAG: hypothetical protein INR73_24610 [Williamsia sp.]|nr:hypothetical protein [Williamsia sp.]